MHTNIYTCIHTRCTQVARLTDTIATLEHELAAERVRYAELLARSDAGNLSI